MGRGRPIHGVALPIPWPNERVKCRIRPLHERFRPVAAVRRDELRREKMAEICGSCACVK